MNNELLERIIKTFEKQLAKVNIEARTYQDVNEYAVVLGEILATAFNLHITEDPGEVIEEILNDRLKENHRLITEFGRLVQDILNKKANIGLSTQIPKVSQDRIDGLVSRLKEDDFEKNKWLLDSPIVNFSQSIVDDMIRKNAEFHFHSGMSPKIVRKEVGNCCKWCKNLVGTYIYPDVPKDVYRRHRNCRCTVEYIPKKGVRQDVHTKKVRYDTKEETKELPYKSVKTEWLKSYDRPKVTDMEYWSYGGTKYFVDGKHVVLDYSKKEKEVAEWLANKLGVHVQMVPRVNYPDEIKSPDYLVNGMKFDLKEITGAGKETLDRNTRKARTQAENIIYDVTNSKLTNDDVKRQLLEIYKSGRRGLNIAVVKRDKELVDIMIKKEST